MTELSTRRDETAEPQPSEVPPASRPPALGWVELARWAWRQLTSMRVALILLFLLAVAAIPGSVVPQTDINPLEVADFRERNPELAEWYDRLGLFDVFAAPWFAAIYLALLVSLVGCILPRSWQHYKAIRARPPVAPKRLSRMPSYQTIEVDAPADEALSAARSELRARRYRLAKKKHVDADAEDSVAGEIGYLRETGNLLFHLSVVGVLLAVGLGGLFGYRANVIVPEGSGFANSVIQFDNLESGAWFDPANLPPFTIEVESFEMDFLDAGSQMGSPDSFEATVEFTPEPGAESETRTIRVNEPLSVDGTLVHILNPGYAPAVTVRSPDGEILSEGPTPFLQLDDNFTSKGVYKVEVPPSIGDQDIGIEALFLPTVLNLEQTGMQSVFPEPRNPALFLTAFHGDLGADDGRPQSIYRLDLDDMTQYRDEENGGPLSVALAPGETYALPDGYTVTFDGWVTWVQFQVSRNAGKEFVLAAAVLAVVGLMGSLYVRRRRAWVRARPGGDRSTVVEVAGLQRTESGAMDSEISALARGVLDRLGEQDKLDKRSNAED